MEPEKPPLAWGIGSSPFNSDAWDKVTGGAQYVDDLRFKGMLHCALLFSPHAHARIVSIDDTEARNAPGVYAVVHCFNTPAVLYNSAIRFHTDDNPADMPVTERVFDQEVKFIGDRVAAVAADTRELARKAVELLKVVYEPLPAVITLDEAIKPEAIQASPFGLGTGNVCGGWVAYGSDSESEVLSQIAQSPRHCVSQFRTSRVHHGYLEPVAHVAQYSRADGLTVWTSSQSVFSFRDVLCGILGLPQSQVRVVKTVSGGAFGGKLEVMHEPVVALLAMRTLHPVKIRLDRKEVFSSTRSRHEAIITISSGFDSEGTLQAQHVLSYLNTGAYASSGPNTVGAQSGKTFVQYDVRHMFYRGAPFYTNTPIAGAMRGYGCPQLMVSREVHMDRIARELGMDPVEFRMKNILRPHVLNCLGKPMHNTLGYECLRTGAQLFGWTDRFQRVHMAKDQRIQVGIGVGTAVHGSGWYGVYQDLTSMTMLMNNDGSLQVLTGIHDLGTGSRTILAQIVGETLSLPLDHIKVMEADTAVTPLDLGAQGSRSTYIGGNCARECALLIKEQLADQASQMLGCSRAHLVFETLGITDGETGRKVSFAGIVDSAQKGRHGPQRQIAATHSYASRMNVYSCSAVFVEVSVDTQEGTVHVDEILSVHSSGRIINPALCEGQVHGGIQMGLGYALSEEMVLDPATGAVLNPTFRNYRMFRADQMPSIKVHFIEDPEASGPYGAKGIGECATDGVAGAVVNAVSNALGGVGITQIPMVPSYVKSLVS